MRQEEKDEFNKMKSEADEMAITTVKYGNHMGYAFSDLETTILYLLTNASGGGIANIYYWEEIGSNANEIIKEASRRGIEINEEAINEISQFYSKLLSLPSTEAYCERIFAHMRQLFPVSRSSCKDDLIRAETLIRVEAEDAAYQRRIVNNS